MSHEALLCDYWMLLTNAGYYRYLKISVTAADSAQQLLPWSLSSQAPVRTSMNSRKITQNSASISASTSLNACMLIFHGYHNALILRNVLNGLLWQMAVDSILNCLTCQHLILWLAALKPRVSYVWWRHLGYGDHLRNWNFGSWWRS